MWIWDMRVIAQPHGSNCITIILLVQIYNRSKDKVDICAGSFGNFCISGRDAFLMFLWLCIYNNFFDKKVSISESVELSISTGNISEIH